MFSQITNVNMYYERMEYIMTLKEALQQSTESVQAWYDEHVASTPLYQQVKSSDTYKNMADLMGDMKSAGKSGYEAFKNSESGQKAAVMSEYVQNTDSFQSVKKSFADTMASVSNTDVSDVKNKAAEYANRAKSMFGGLFAQDTEAESNLGLDK